LILKVISSFLNKTAPSSSFLDLVINQSINNPLINNKDPIIEIKESNNIFKVRKKEMQQSLEELKESFQKKEMNQRKMDRLISFIL
jgi:hypothetical protein